MLKDAVAAADSVIVSGDYDPWSVFGNGFSQQVVSDSRSCREKKVVRRKVSKDISEHWLGAQGANFLPTGPSVSLTGVPTSEILKNDKWSTLPFRKMLTVHHALSGVL